MNSIDEDPIIGHFFDTAEKKAKWLVRIKIAYIFWIIFVIIGFIIYVVWYILC